MLPGAARDEFEVIPNAATYPPRAKSAFGSGDRDNCNLDSQPFRILHQGRFSASYHAIFGELPSTTLARRLR